MTGGEGREEAWTLWWSAMDCESGCTWGSDGMLPGDCFSLLRSWTLGHFGTKLGFFTKSGQGGEGWDWDSAAEVGCGRSLEGGMGMSYGNTGREKGIALVDGGRGRSMGGMQLMCKSSSFGGMRFKFKSSFGGIRFRFKSSSFGGIRFRFKSSSFGGIRFKSSPGGMQFNPLPESIHLRSLPPSLPDPAFPLSYFFLHSSKVEQSYSPEALYEEITLLAQLKRRSSYKQNRIENPYVLL